MLENTRSITVLYWKCEPWKVGRVGSLSTSKAPSASHSWKRRVCSSEFCTVQFQSGECEMRSPHMIAGSEYGAWLMRSWEASHVLGGLYTAISLKEDLLSLTSSGRMSSFA